MRHSTHNQPVVIDRQRATDSAEEKQPDPPIRLRQPNPLWTHTLFLVSLLLLGMFFLKQVQAETAVASPDATMVADTADSPTEPLPAPEMDDIKSGTFFLSSSYNFVDVPAISSSVRMSISGIVARVTLEQTFDNTGANWVEGIYAFPLPDNAAINALTITVGERTIKGQVREKAMAETLYRQARNEGKVASLVRQHRPNLFSTRIANIAPGTPVQVKLEYIQLITPSNDRFSLRFPMTLTPRYSNKTVNDVGDITPPQVRLEQAQRHSPANAQMDIHVTLHGTAPLMALSSPSHEVIQQQFEDRVELALPGSIPMDQDFLLSWQFQSTDLPTVSTWQETIDNSNYLLAMLLPPDNEVAPLNQARELILVVDTSGSMAGESMRAAIDALTISIDGLSTGDRFNVIAFDSVTRKLFPTAAEVNERSIATAKRFIKNLVADGGTEMEPAIRAALANQDRNRLRQIVFITDGSVGNEEYLFDIIALNLRESRLFTVGIGSAPNEWFMRKAAETGRGTFTFIGNNDDATVKMGALFRKLEQPALTDLHIEWSGGTAEYTPSPLQDLYQGEPLIIAAKIDDSTDGFEVRGNHGFNEWSQRVTLDSTPLVETGLSTVWARRKIESLLDEQRQAGIEDQYKDLITQIALTHQLSSPYTSFVAIDETPVRAPGEPLASSKIPNLMPAGSQMSPISYPQGASGSDTLLLICFLSIVAMFIFRTGSLRREIDYADIR